MDPLKQEAGSSAAGILKIVAKFISTMSQQDLRDLASGVATLKLVRRERPARQVEMAIGAPGNTVPYYEKLRDELGSVESTIDGHRILRDAQLTRSELEKFARSLDLPVTKKDSIARLEEKIVESLIGSRLNSRAVRGR
jgi:hypothetical protein